MSCFSCSHNQPQGCLLKRPEYETYTECPEYDQDNLPTEKESEDV
jgi:hypothetical protein